MKKILAMGLAAVALLAMTQQRASAWSKCNFGVGLRLGWEGGGNSVLWGLAKGAQVPGYEGGGGSFDGPGFDAGMPAPAPMPYPAPEKIAPPVKPANYDQPANYYNQNNSYQGYYQGYGYQPWYWGR